MRHLAWLLLIYAAPASAADYGSDEFIKSRFPIPDAIKSISRQQTGDPFGPGEKLAPGALGCKGAEVEAATPGQYTKKYHADAFVFYNEQKVPGSREVAPDPAGGKVPGNYVTPVVMCKMPSNGGNLNPATNDKWCMMAKVGRYTMMSDYFFCRVGDDVRFFRGYWESAAIYQGYNRANPMSTFRTENEHIMTMSLGRGDNMQADAYGNYDSVPGPTFGVERSRFLFFTRANDQDILAIDKAISQLSGTYERCPNGSFKVKGQGSCPK